MLWHWTAKFSPQGDIGKWTDFEIARAAGWELEPDEFVSGLVQTNLAEIRTEHRLVIHDWHDHADDSCKKWLERHGLAFVSLPVQILSENVRKNPDTTPSTRVQIPAENSRQNPKKSGLAPARSAPAPAPAAFASAAASVVAPQPLRRTPAQDNAPAKLEPTPQSMASPISTTIENKQDEAYFPATQIVETSVDASVSFNESESSKPRQRSVMHQQIAEANAKKKAGPASEGIKNPAPNGNHATLEKLVPGVEPLIDWEADRKGKLPRTEKVPADVEASYLSLYPKDEIDQVRNWIYEHCASNSETARWAPPDVKIAVGVLMAKGERPLTAIHDWLFDLRKRRLYPEQSHQWFVTLAAKHFVALPPAKAPDCAICWDTGLVTEKGAEVHIWDEVKHSHLDAKPCTCGKLPPVWWRDMYGDRALPETEEERASVMPRRRA